MVSATEAEVRKFNLAETLDIASVNNLYVDLRTLLDSGMPIILDGSAVSRADTAALQILVSMFMYAAAHQCKLEWHSPSAALVNVAALLGLDRHIGLNN